MSPNYFISIYLDTRRAKKSGKYPVKLRIFTSQPRKQKLYSTKFEFTQEEFDKVWNSQQVRKKEYKTLRVQLQAIESHANELAQSMNVFSFEQFEKKYKQGRGIGKKVVFHYQEIISKNEKLGRESTKERYKLSLNSIKNFLEYKVSTSIEYLTFYDITQDWLENFERYMIEVKKYSTTTAGIYIRSLRTVFNKAIDEGEVEREIYPFGKRKYTIPVQRKTKKALSSEELKILFEAVCSNKGEEKAKDFWFFSYFCNGINFKDVALLTYQDIEGDKFEFYRAKTYGTSKDHLTPIVVHLNTFTKQVIEKYGNKDKSPESLVFPILSDKNLSSKEIRRQVSNFNRNINHNIKQLAKANGVQEGISSYWARHSFATTAIRKGASLEFIQESLGHGNIKTTQNYFAGFEDKTKKEFAEKLLKF